MNNYSPKFTMTSTDWSKWGKNTLTFLAPVIIIYLTAVVVQIETDGFSLDDFIPSTITIGSMVLYLVNIVIDFLRKFVPERFE